MRFEEATTKGVCTGVFNNLSMMETFFPPHLYLVGLESGAVKAGVR